MTDPTESDSPADAPTALVIMAHPDDVDFGSAGLVRQWVEEGLRVTYGLITNGDAGGFDPTVPRADIAGIRQAEQRAAAAELGVDDVVFLGYPDGQLEVTRELRRDLAQLIRQVRPMRALVQEPQRTFVHIAADHPDHLVAGEAALCAIYPDARNPYAMPELAEDGLEAWSVPETWIACVGQVSTWVDITDQFERKLAALRAHRSQTEHMDLEEFVGGWNRRNAEQAGLPPGSLAEGYRVMDTR